jgi:WD40 repeat protein
MEQSHVAICQVDGGGEPRAFRAPIDNAEVMAVAFSPDGKRMAAAIADRHPVVKPGLVAVWDVLTGEEKLQLRGHEHTVTGVTYSPDGKWLASCDAQQLDVRGNVKVWNASNGQESMHGTKLTGERGVHQVEFSPDSKYLAAAAGVIKVWRTSDWKAVDVRNTGSRRNFKGVTFSPNGQYLAGLNSARLLVWNFSTWEPVTFGGGWMQADSVRATGGNVAFSPTGRRLATVVPGSLKKTGQIELWDLTTGQKVFSIATQASALAFSPDGKRLAGGLPDGCVLIWNADPGP